NRRDAARLGARASRARPGGTILSQGDCPQTRRSPQGARTGGVDAAVAIAMMWAARPSWSGVCPTSLAVRPTSSQWLPQRLLRRFERLADYVGFAGNHLEIGSCRLVGLGSPLLPVAQRPYGY